MKNNRHPSRILRTVVTSFALALTALMTLGAEGGCGAAVEAAAEKVPDFRGNYEIAHDDGVTVYLTLGGTEYIEDGIQGQIIDVGGVEVDMDEVCDFDGVHCPSEVYWSQVGLDQPYFDREAGKNPWLIKVINLKTNAHQLEVGGLVNSVGDLTLLLGLVTTDEPPCGPLGSSVSTADFELDIDGEPTGKIRNGRIRVEYSGACLFPGDEALAGATVMFETFFEGQRTGPLSVPESLRSLPTYDENGQPF